LVEIGHRVDRARSLAHLKVQLGAVRITGHTGKCQFLAALDLVAALHLQLRSMAVNRHKTIFMAYENGVGEALQAIAAIDHHAILSRTDRRSFRNGDIDTVIALAP